MRTRILLLTAIAVSLGLRGASQQPTFQALLDSGKAEFKRQNSEQEPDFSRALHLLNEAVKLNPQHTEARYFLGYTLDRISMSDAKKMNVVTLSGTIKASEQFEEINKLEPKYSGELFILDPYTKVTALWGSLALAYLSQHKKDSARWAFKEGKRRGGYLESQLIYCRLTLSSCEKNSILFTTGDATTLPVYYLLYVVKTKWTRC